MKAKIRHFRYGLRSHVGAHWHGNKKLFFWLSSFTLLGIGIALFTIFDPNLHHFRFMPDLLDGNIVNVMSPSRGIMGFIVVRFSDIVLGLLLVFIFGLSRWTVFFIFPFVALRGFWIVMNLFWIVNRFGFLHGLPFIITYFLVFMVVAIVFICGCIYAIKKSKQIRCFGFRSCVSFREDKRPVGTIIFAAVTIAVIEFFLYFLILARMLYVF